MKKLLSIFAVVGFVGPCLSNAQTGRPNYGSYEVLQTGGLLEIPTDTTYGPMIVEGSTAIGGMQPDYILDTDSPEIQDFLAKVEKIARLKDIDMWEKIENLRELVPTYMEEKAYDSPRYLSLMKTAREEGRAVRLSEYLQINAGVCREYNLLMLVGMQRLLKINRKWTREQKAKIFYAVAEVHLDGNVRLGSSRNINGQREDHAILIFEVSDSRGRATQWVIESYNVYHGSRLVDLQDPSGTLPTAPAMPRVIPKNRYRRVYQIYPNFPKVWVPRRHPILKKKMNICRKALEIS